MKAQYLEAIINFEKSLNIYKEISNIRGQVNTLNKLGIVYSKISNLSISLNYYLQCAESNKIYKDSSIMATIYNNIGVLYSDLNLPLKAIDYYNEALEIDLALLDTVNTILDYNNLGDVNLKVNNKKESYEYLKQAYQLTQIFNLNDTLMIIIDQTLGEYFLEAEKYDSAYFYLNKALLSNKKLDNKNELSYSSFVLGKYYEKIHNSLKAINYYKNALSINKTFEFTSLNAEIIFHLSNSYYSLRMYKKAYESSIKSKQISDSLNFRQVRRALSDYELQKELERTRIEEILKQEKSDLEIENSAYRYRLFIIGMAIFLFMLLLIMGAFIRAYIIKRKSHIILEDQNKVIELQKEDLRQLNATKDKFFSLIAHDLKNPFNIMIGYSDLLLFDDEYRSPDKINEILTIINRTAVLSHTFLENLLDWARSQSGILKVEAIDFNLNELIQDNVNFFAENARLKGIKLNTKLDDDVQVFADRRMIDTIVRNLLSNAIKFTNIGGKVTITNQTENDHICISVTDNGIGIHKENIDKLFKIDENYQVDGTANEKGTGLGLILCKEFIDKNKGTIIVESQVGKGSTFVICIPMTK